MITSKAEHGQYIWAAEFENVHPRWEFSEPCLGRRRGNTLSTHWAREFFVEVEAFSGSVGDVVCQVKLGPFRARVYGHVDLRKVLIHTGDSFLYRKRESFVF